MGSSTVGSLEPFDATKEDWSAYTETFDQIILTNEIEGEKKKFLTMVGSNSYNLLRDLQATAKPLFTVAIKL